MGLSNPEIVLTIDDIVKSDDCFFVATGITDGTLMKGIRKTEDGSILTHSFLTVGGMDEKIQFIEAYHRY